MTEILGKGISVGLFQINTGYWPQLAKKYHLFRPVDNAQAAYEYGKYKDGVRGVAMTDEQPRLEEKTGTYVSGTEVIILVLSPLLSLPGYSCRRESSSAQLQIRTRSTIWSPSF